MSRFEDYEINKWGFPLVECSRCGGTGKHSWNQRFGDTCFKCGGTGKAIHGKAAKAWQDFKRAKEEANNTVVLNVKSGDEILVNREWKIVDHKRVDIGDVRGWKSTNNEPPIETSWGCVIVFKDGSEWDTQTNLLIKRRGVVVSPEPYLELVKL